LPWLLPRCKLLGFASGWGSLCRLAMFRATGTELDLRYWLAALAEAYGKIGQVEKGVALLAEAQAELSTGGERFEAELHRLRGALTLQSKVQGLKPVLSLVEGPHVEEEAEACFLKAIEIARHQQAKSLELRAVMSLSQLWQGQGKTKEAHEL